MVITLNHITLLKAKDISTMANFNFVHPATNKQVVINKITVDFTSASLDGKRSAIAVLKKMLAELHLSWPENAKERDFIISMEESERIEYLDKWSTFIEGATLAISDIMGSGEPPAISEKIAKNLMKAGISIYSMKFEIVGTKTVTTPPIRYVPQSGRLETIDAIKDYGVDDVRTYDIFDGEIAGHHEAKMYYVPKVTRLSDASLSYITETPGATSGNMQGVLNSLKQYRTYRDSEDKKMFRSLLTVNSDPTEIIESAKKLIEETVQNKALKAMELDELTNAGPFDRYPVEYWYGKLLSSYEPKDTSFDLDIYKNAWKIVARIIKKTIVEHDSHVKKSFPSLAHQRAKLFQPDEARTARDRKRETTNAGFPTFKKFLGDDWEQFIAEAESIAANPQSYDPTKYPMIVGNRIVGKDLKIPAGLSEDEEFDYISAKNKQRVIQMGSSVEFIIGSRFMHPTLRLLSTKCEHFKGLKSWMGVRGDIALRIKKHVKGITPISTAFGADASNFDASITIQDWVMTKRLFQMIFPDHTDLLEWYFTLCAFSPTITLDGKRQPIVLSGCSGMASGVACTAIVDSIVELVRSIAVLIEVGMIDNDPLATVHKDLGLYVCGDDMGMLIPASIDNGKLTASEFSRLYAKYGGTAHADKQLVTHPDSELGITLLFLKRLFSERKDVGFGTRLMANTITGLIYTNPSDFTSANRVLEGFLSKSNQEDELERLVFGIVAESDHFDNVTRGDLSEDPKDVLRMMKKQGEANRKARALIESVDSGDYEPLNRLRTSSDVIWVNRVSNLASLLWLVEHEIITEDEMYAQLERSVEMLPYDLSRLHLIKVVQQIEENHPHPSFKAFVEWCHSLNTEFFNIKLLEGDEAAHMANFIKAQSKERGIENWKIMPLLRSLCFGQDKIFDTYPTKAEVLECLVREKRTVTYLSSILNCLGMPFDTTLENVRLVLKELHSQKNVFLAAKCDNEVMRLDYIAKHVLILKSAVKNAANTGDETEVMNALNGMIGMDQDLIDVYSSVKKNAISKEGPIAASVSPEIA